MRRFVALFAIASLVALVPQRARAGVAIPGPLWSLQHALHQVTREAPGRVAMEIKDLRTGYISAVNPNAVMPAASTIKIPVMVEVFRQMEEGRFDLNRRVELLATDRDWGSGSLCDAPVGSTYPVSQLLQAMISVSDNTAANMLIRLVGRRNINREMYRLGLRHTDLGGYIKTDAWTIRDTLRTTPADMVSILYQMAREKLVDPWSSRQMIAILENDQINTLLPEPLPDIPIAHKTGSLHDTLDDVGIVYATGAPYVIAVMTTDLPTLSVGRRFIHRVSKLAYHGIERFAQWRRANGMDFSTPAPQDAAFAPPADTPMWGPDSDDPIPAPHATQAPDSGG